MTYFKQRRSRLARAIFVNAVAFFFALQSLAVAGQMSGRPAYHDQVGAEIVSNFDGLSCNPQSGDAGPGSSHRHLSKCCILCALRSAADMSPQLVEATYGQATNSDTRSLSSVDYSLSILINDGPSTWISSRSPRGPPTLS